MLTNLTKMPYAYNILFIRKLINNGSYGIRSIQLQLSSSFSNSISIRNYTFTSCVHDSKFTKVKKSLSLSAKDYTCTIKNKFEIENDDLTPKIPKVMVTEKPISEFLACDINDPGFHKGDLIMNNSQVNINISVNNQDAAFQVVSGSGYSQISRDLATKLRLKGHPKMVSKSTIHGKDKYQYLIPATIKFDKFEYPLVINMSNEPPNFIGMDLVISAGMNMDFVNLKYEVFPPAVKVPPSFDLMKLEDILKYFNLNASDLIPVHELPLEVTNNEYKKSAFDLGESYYYQSIHEHPKIYGPQF